LTSNRFTDNGIAAVEIGTDVRLVLIGNLVAEFIDNDKGFDGWIRNDTVASINAIWNTPNPITLTDADDIRLTYGADPINDNDAIDSDSGLAVDYVNRSDAVRLIETFEYYYGNF